MTSSTKTPSDWQSEYRADHDTPGEPGQAPVEFWTSERCYITELMNSGQQPAVSLARTRVQPGILTQLHSLSIAEWYVIERGEGWMRVGDDEPYRVGPGDHVHIPVDCAQQIENRGNVDLVFLCVCMPRFEPHTYRSLEHDD